MSWAPGGMSKAQGTRRGASDAGAGSAPIRGRVLEDLKPRESSGPGRHLTPYRQRVLGWQSGPLVTSGRAWHQGDGR